MNSSITLLFELTGQCAIVTGGVMGIGKGIAKRLAEAGCDVVILDIAEHVLAEATIEELSIEGGRMHYLQVDLSNAALLQSAVEEAVHLMGDVNILVNNAGIFTYSPAIEMTEALWDRTMNINLKATMFLSKYVAKHMIAHGHGGRIINISSIDSLKPTGHLAQYDASKGGVRMLTRALAKEWGKHGITVNDIAPGGVNTPGVQKIAGRTLTAEEQAAAAAQTAQFISMLPLQRMGEPEDIGNAALFLASKAATYITGSTLVVDGGLLIM